MTGPAPVPGSAPGLTSDDTPAGTGGPTGVEVCQHCRQVRRETALMPTADGWQCREPCRSPGGRPPVGPPVLIRMPAELRAAVEARALPGESLAATARRLLAAAVTQNQEPAQAAPEASAAAAPHACPDCGTEPELSLGRVAMCGPCGRPFDMTKTPAARAAAIEATTRRVTGSTAAIDGPRVVLAETWRGDPVVIGPVYTDKGAAEIETVIGNHGGWTVSGPVRYLTKARLPWALSTWGNS